MLKRLILYCLLARLFELIQCLSTNKSINLMLLKGQGHTQAASNADLKMIGTFLENTLEPKMQPRNLGELSDIVKNRLAKNAANKEQKYVCREWLKENGMNIQPLLEYLSFKRKHQTEAKDKDREQPAPEPIGHDLMQPILFNHEEYSVKAMQYAETNLMQFIASKREVRKRYFKNAMINLGCPPVNSNSTVVVPVVAAYSTRDRSKRDKYIAIIKQLTDMELQTSNKQLQDPLNQSTKTKENDKVARLLFEGVPHKLWSILYKQVKGVDFELGKLQLMTELLINSLKVVEEEFSEDLPLNRHALTFYLQQKYLNKFEGNGEYQFHAEHGSIWGKIFLYFRAGKLKEATDLLQKIYDTGLVRDIEINFNSIKRKQPHKVRIDGSEKNKLQDVFRDQLLYALGGERKYSSDVLSNPASLDCVWILLRNTGIYYATDSSEYDEIKAHMVEYYTFNRLERELVYFGAYLLDYDSLARSRENEMLDKDDLMHLLIVLHRYPSLMNNKPILEQRLTEYATSYALELAGEGREEYVYYILMIPSSRLVEEASSMIATNKLYSDVPWATLQKYLPEDLFMTLMVTTSQKYIISTNNYLEAATNLVELVSARHAGLNLLTEMLLDHIQQRKIYRGEEVTKALRYYCNWSTHSETDPVYSKLFELLDNSVRLTKALVDRNLSLVHEIVSQKGLVFGENIGYENCRMLEKMRDCRGLQVFFIYLSSLMRSVNLVFSHEHQPEELRHYRQLIYRTAKTVTEDTRFQADCSGQTVSDLLFELSSGLIEGSFENYHDYT